MLGCAYPTPPNLTCRRSSPVIGSARVRLRKPAATEIVLGLLCLMYLITYVDRTNVATAAGEIRKELRLTATQWGYIASAFGYPYILFQVFGGWVGDRFGPRRTLFACGLVRAVATILTSLAGGFLSLLLVRVMLGFWRGRHVPGGDPRHASVDASRSPGLRTGHHPRVCAIRQRHHAADCRVAGCHHQLARVVPGAWLSEPGVGRRLGVVFSGRPGRASCHHGRRARSAAASRRGGRIAAARRAVEASGGPDDAGDHRLLLLRLDALALPQLAAAVFPAGVQGQHHELGDALVDRVRRRRRRRLCRRDDQRSRPAADGRPDQGAAQRDCRGLPELGAVPCRSSRDRTIIVNSLAARSSARSVIGPMGRARTSRPDIPGRRAAS